MNDGISTADILAMTRTNDNEMWNNPFIYLVWLAVLGGGFGNGGLFGGGNAATQGAFTRADLTAGLNAQDNSRNQANIMQEIGAFERESASNWGDMKYDNLVGVNTINAALNQNRFDASKCCWTFAAA